VHANPQKGFRSWVQRIANQHGCAPTHSFADRLSCLAGGKLYKRDHFLGKDQIFMLATPGMPLLTNTPEVQAASHYTAATGDQVDDQDDQRHHQQKVDQGTGDVKAEAQKPQNQKNDKNCPEHLRYTLSTLRTPETGNSGSGVPNDVLTNRCYFDAIACAFACLTASINGSADAGVATSPRRTRCVETSGP